MRQRQGWIATATTCIIALTQVGRRPVGTIRASGETAQIVEAELRRYATCKLRRGRIVQVAQQPIAQPLAGPLPQLLLDGLQRPAERRPPPRQRLLQIEQAR